MSLRKNVVAAFALAALAIPGAAARADHDTRVVRAGGSAAGKTIGEWTGEWWQAAIEASDFPFPVGGVQPGALGGSRPVFFAVASPGPGFTVYTYTVPRGKFVLLPLYTYSWAVQSSEDPCSAYACAARLSDRFVRATKAMSVSIDGEEVEHPFEHFERTPQFFEADAPVDGWWAGGDPAFAGPWFGYASGYWLMLKPLSPGRHVVWITVKAPYSSVCADGTDTCDIPFPGMPELAKTGLILTVR
ncbi:MAG TPA: hypothetical protein VL131_07755 [Gammaproteobacteria bacterium]|nr:hypothetical protein [Gammaproteobacteria bacterium]